MACLFFYLPVFDKVVNEFMDIVLTRSIAQ